MVSWAMPPYEECAFRIGHMANAATEERVELLFAAIEDCLAHLSR